MPSRHPCAASAVMSTSLSLAALPSVCLVLGRIDERLDLTLTPFFLPYLILPNSINNMGLRGFQGLARKQAKEAVAGRKRKRILPWERRGMSRVAKGDRVSGIFTDHERQADRAQTEAVAVATGLHRGSVRARGKRPVRLGIFSEPRGNGKTGLIAGLALCHLLGPEAEMRGECYSAGIDRLQAGADLQRDGSDHPGGAGVLRRAATSSGIASRSR